MEAIAEIETAASENYHSATSWLKRHRFYLNQEQCNRVNAALRRIQEEPMEVGEIRIEWSVFLPDPGLNDSYFENEAANHEVS